MPIHDRSIIRGWFLLFLIMGLCLPACSTRPLFTQPGIWFRSSAEAMQTQLLNVAFPLLTAAAEWCPYDQEPTYGFLLRERAAGESAENNPEQRPAMVAYVHLSLPAAWAGLSVGDEIHSVNTVNVTEDSPDDVDRLIAQLTRAKIQPLQLEILRGGERRLLALSAVPACHYSVQVLDTPLINGITDGRQIGVTRGAMQFFPWDDELGWVVAHEIAHNILNHSENVKFQAMVRTFLRAWGETSDSLDREPLRPSLETQADYVGAYLMARAGYDLDAVRRVWERLERIESAQQTGPTHLHPPTRARLAAFELTLQEIEAKRRTAQPLQILLKDDDKPTK